MPFFNYDTKKEIKIWEGVFGKSIPSNHVTFGLISLQRGAKIPVHRHRYEQWTHIIEGKLEFDVNGEKKIVTSNMAIHILPNTPHCARALSDCKILECFLSE